MSDCISLDANSFWFIALTEPKPEALLGIVELILRVAFWHFNVAL